MNERIKELAEQADKEAFPHGSMAWMEVFAELIVRECVDWCDAYATVDGTAQKIAEAIKEHFGVE